MSPFDKRQDRANQYLISTTVARDRRAKMEAALPLYWRRVELLHRSL